MLSRCLCQETWFCGGQVPPQNDSVSQTVLLLVTGGVKSWPQHVQSSCFSVGLTLCCPSVRNKVYKHARTSSVKSFDSTAHAHRYASCARHPQCSNSRSSTRTIADTERQRFDDRGRRVYLRGHVPVSYLYHTHDDRRVSARRRRCGVGRRL